MLRAACCVHHVGLLVPHAAGSIFWLNAPARGLRTDCDSPAGWRPKAFDLHHLLLSRLPILGADLRPLPLLAALRVEENRLESVL